MSENVQKLSEGDENTIFGHFLDNFCLFGRCFCLVTLSNARPLQVKRAVIPNARVQLWVCFFLHGGSLPRCEGANLGAFNLCHFGLLKWGCANSGVFGAHSNLMGNFPMDFPNIVNWIPNHDFKRVCACENANASSVA